METKPRWTKWVEYPTTEQWEVLDRLTELGAQRRELAARKAYMTSSGRQRLDEIYSELRKAMHRGEARGLGHVQMRQALGLTSTAYFKIKNGTTGSGA